MVRVRLKMLLATVNHRVVQVAVAHLHIDMKISLIRKSRVVETTTLKVAIFEENFAGS